MTKRQNIPFSPPDITQAEIDEVIDTLKSGWITTGPKTKELECRLSVFTGTNKTVCLNSATAGLELVLRVLGVGPG
ncbi:DegT/DnrJ/EryC1/StrS family aminotransferase, partial [Streptococcus suis]